MMHTILIVDDEQDIREILQFNLEKTGYRCLTAASGTEALEVIANQQVDLILLDVMMPGMSGFEVAERVKDIPVVFLTALSEEDDLLRGFSLGADDYIAKPFSIREVLARVEAVLRRKTVKGPSSLKGQGDNADGSSSVGYENLQLDGTIFTGTIDGTDIGLTKMEYELLNYLLQHQGVVCSRADLLKRVWPDNGLVLERTVDVTITRLRKKIGIYKDHLKAKTGYGYYWEK